MKYIVKVLKFGAPYLRHYWFRFVAGVLLGLVFASANASFVVAVNYMVTRLDKEKQVSLVAAEASPSAPKKKVNERSLKARIGKALAPIGRAWDAADEAVSQTVDRWTPLAGRPLDWKQIVGGLLSLPLLSFFRGATGYLSSYCMAWTSRMVMIDLKRDVYAKLNSLSLDFFSKTTTGDLILRVNGDTGALYGCLSLGMSDLVKEPFTLLAVFFALWHIDRNLTLISLVFLPVCVLPTLHIGSKIRRIAKQGVKAGIFSSDLLVQAFANIRVVKAFGLEPVMAKQFDSTIQMESRMNMRMVQSKELVNPIIETVSAMGIGVVILYVFWSGHTVAVLASFLTGLGLFYTPLKKIAGIHLTFQQSSIGVDRLMEIIHLKPTIEDAPDAKSLPSFERQIEVRDVSFEYIAGRKVLDHVNLTIPKGFKLGLAGESGAGKSSLLNLLYRFWDVNEGAILIDGIDVRKIKFVDLRSQMALVNQDVLLFNTSIANNIAYGRANCTHEEIIEAAKSAYAHDFIMATSAGYDTPIGERGVLLSGGQKQRLSIARAFVRNAPILVLDEATASLDSAAETEVQRAIEHLAENRTVISVAHRLSTLATCDQIVVLSSQGRIIESGTFNELIDLQGSFAEMARKQGITLALAGG